MKKSISYDAVSLLLTSLMIINLLAILPVNISHAQGNTMNFTTGEIIDFHSTTTMSFWSGVSFQFGTGIILQFLEVANGNGILEPCDVIQLQPPFSYTPQLCEWWEVLDPQGNPTGIEFHIDGQQGPTEWHIDMVYPGPIPLPYPPQTPFTAEKKIDRIEPCNYFVVHWPVGWYPAPCTWWEIMNPETHEPTGYEFHVDWTNESCEFHIDEMIPGPYILPFPWHMLEARQKIATINACDWFYILDLPGFDQPNTWWEVLDPNTGEPTGLEFHIDIAPGDGTFHVDQTDPPGGISIPISYPTKARQKIDTIEPCSWFEVDDPTTVPKTCTWWKIVRPDMGDVEFHVDQYDPNTGQFHIDQVLPSPMQIQPIHQLAAEKKFAGISPCDWLRVEYPNGFLPTVCSWWRITWPPEWAGVELHVDSTNGISKFHIDTIDPLPQGPTPPPWNVTAEEFTPEDPWYWKPNYDDYVPSGVPDFDQRQGGTYVWQDQAQQWSHCGPVAVANSLWWLDSEFEPNPIPPPVINDGYPLVQSYGQWDDHDPQNVPWLVEHLAYLMDTDGRRTGLVHSGTNVHDMEAGLSHYLSWTGVNPQGDVNGDGEVNQTDVDIVSAAHGSSPGMPNWNLAADVFPVSTTYPPLADNVVNMLDLNFVAAHVGQKGTFYEHTVMTPGFSFIEEEVKRCQDVVLLVGYWIFDTQSGIWYREPGGHYVTVAGVDSLNQKLALSDPVQDAFETGLIPEGRIPTPHTHMPPEPPYVTHNNAAFVSQDIYNVQTITPPFPPCPGGNLMLANFASWRPAPPFFAVIESAVVTSPLAVHDIAVTDVTTSKDGCKPKPTLCENYTAEIKVKVRNQGGYVESFFDVFCYVSDLLSTYEVGMQTISLNPDETANLTFTWDTHGFAKGDYTVWAYAEPVAGETETADNTYADGTVTITMQGDINADNIVDIFDIVRVALAFGAVPADPNWDPNADINGDRIIDIFDIVIVALHFGETSP
jgi:hypothetical protein